MSPWCAGTKACQKFLWTVYQPAFPQDTGEGTKQRCKSIPKHHQKLTVQEGRRHLQQQEAEPLPPHHLRQDYWSIFINKQVIRLNKIWTKLLWNPLKFLGIFRAEALANFAAFCSYTTKCLVWLDCSKSDYFSYYFYFYLIKQNSKFISLCCCFLLSGMLDVSHLFSLDQLALMAIEFQCTKTFVTECQLKSFRQT